jgi:hypothetical protein
MVNFDNKGYVVVSNIRLVCEGFNTISAVDGAFNL